MECRHAGPCIPLPCGLAGVPLTVRWTLYHTDSEKKRSRHVLGRKKALVRGLSWSKKTFLAWFSRRRTSASRCAFWFQDRSWTVILSLVSLSRACYDHLHSAP